MQTFHTRSLVLSIFTFLIHAILSDGLALGAQKESDDDYAPKEIPRHITNDKQASLAQVDINVHSNNSGSPAANTTTLPPSHFYSDAQKVEHYLEKRRGVEFFPEGASPDVDMGSAAVEELEEEFSESPDVFGHCVLIRDFATPLRVGSGLNTIRPKSLMRALANSTKAHLHSQQFVLNRDPMRAHFQNKTMRKGSLSRQVVLQPKSSFVQLHNEEENVGEMQKDGSSEDAQPDLDMIYAKGSIMEKNTASHEAELEVSMFAWLTGFPGEVAVIPNGVISKWSSKKKVPIAGYLCSHEEGTTLHTLPTPCLETTLDENGTPHSMPQHRSFRSAPASAVFAQTKTQRGAGAAPNTSTSVGSPPAPAPVQAPNANANVAPPASVDPAATNYHIYVGDVLLHFTSKRKGQRFCKHLAQRIADDLGDTEWSSELIKQEELRTDMDVGAFVQMLRRPPQKEWTTGSKTLLVVLMDWQRGDRSKVPLSKQTLKPSYYEKVIMPRVQQAFEQMSFGKYTIKPTVVPGVIPFTRQRARYAAHGYPFPSLYDGAKESLAGNPNYGLRYSFDNYDLVYVLSPQQAPAGTKGVAWVGAKGAMCNGCEKLSENFQVMVAVHEIGHNLGLSHASSNSLEYGNPFDWMGNYPDVTGLTFGLSYKVKLHWIPQQYVWTVNERNLNQVNHKVIIKAFDSLNPPKRGEIVGVKISLHSNQRDIFVAFRHTAGKQAGIYITLEDREKPNSELIDMGCHTPSQRDARLQPGWTYMDPSGQVVVKVVHVRSNVATMHIYKAPGGSRNDAIRERALFSDGTYKCPRTCTDSELLVSQFQGCSNLQKQGYCKHGALNMGGKQRSIGKDLCPESCGECDAALAGSTLVGSTSQTCSDKSININHKSCSQIAIAGMCEAVTNIGHVGRDLCPKSCGNCPKKPSFTQTNTQFNDPPPHGVLGSGQSFLDYPLLVSSTDHDETETDDEKETDDVDESEGKQKTHATCQDDPDWADKDGDGCAVYSRYISQGRIKRKRACEYNDGQATQHCPLTCGSCPSHDAHANQDSDAEQDSDGNQDSDATPKCEDRSCIAKWMEETGQCYQCTEAASKCADPHVKHDCPVTCGLCSPENKEGPKMDNKLPSKPCEDNVCIDGWLAKHGTCYKCEDFAADYCGRDKDVMLACPKTCKLCDGGSQDCTNDFRDETCDDYVSWGWCSHREVRLHCRNACNLCGDDDDDDTFLNPWEEGSTQDSRETSEDGEDSDEPMLHSAAFGQLHVLASAVPALAFALYTWYLLDFVI